MAVVTNIFTRPSLHLSGFVAVSIVAHLLLMSYWFQSSAPLPITIAPLSVTMLQPQDEKIGTTKQTSRVASKLESAKPDSSNADTRTVAEQMRSVEPVVIKEQTAITVPVPKPQSDKSIDAISVAEGDTVATSSAPSQIVMQQEQSRTKQPSQLQTDNENKAKQSLSLTQVRERIRDHLHENLDRHFYYHYPRLARKRGWQGEVLLTLKIESDGVISRILITKSTGYSLLDETAIKTVKKISNVKKMGQWLNGRSIEMELPVIYRLTNS